MSKPIQEEQLIENDDEYEDDIGPGDYGFIIGPDGELKHLFTPDDFVLDPPPVVQKILKALGIKDINAVAVDGNETLH